MGGGSLSVTEKEEEDQREKDRVCSMLVVGVPLRADSAFYPTLILIKVSCQFSLICS